MPCGIKVVHPWHLTVLYLQSSPSIRGGVVLGPAGNPNLRMLKSFTAQNSIFHPLLINSEDAGPAHTEGQLYLFIVTVWSTAIPPRMCPISSHTQFVWIMFLIYLIYPISLFNFSESLLCNSINEQLVKNQRILHLKRILGSIQFNSFIWCTLCYLKKCECNFKKR